jgi:hypothetical protein
VARIREIQRRLSQSRLPIPDYLCRIKDRVMLITNILQIEQCVDNSYWIRVRACYTAGEQYFRCPKPPPQPPQQQPPSAHSAAEWMSSDSENSDNDESSDGSNFHLPQIDAAKAVFEEINIPIPTAVADDYAKLITLKNWLDKLIASFPRDVGSRAITHRLHGSVPAWLPFVRRDFLEKDEIRPWMIDELQMCIAQRTGKCPVTSVLRGSFVVPLKLVLQQLSLAEDGSWRYALPLLPKDLDLT